ncbi:MAG: GIY-YIG nuclease family protein [Chloroflexota bacterium]
MYYVYILKCADGSYYTGSTSDLSSRVVEHEMGLIPKAYTRSRRPVKLVWFDTFPSRDDAIERERQIKGWSRRKKVALIRNDWEEIHQIVQEERKRREAEEKKKSKR